MDNDYKGVERRKNEQIEMARRFIERGPLRDPVNCKKCHGIGVIISSLTPCKHCDGRGVVEADPWRLTQTISQKFAWIILATTLVSAGALAIAPSWTENYPFTLGVFTGSFLLFLWHEVSKVKE